MYQNNYIYKKLTKMKRPILWQTYGFNCFKHNNISEYDDNRVLNDHVTRVQFFFFLSRTGV